ncbi:MAG: AraC family transcriptional regulator [Oleispira sp.]
MILWLKPSASAEIAKYVECYWFIEKTADSNSYQFPKLNPDPSAHLIISPPAQAYHYDLNPGVVNGEGSHWLFPHQATFQLDHSQPFAHLGIKFHPGALYALGVGNDSALVLDTVEAMELNELFKSSLNQEQLLELAKIDAEQCCQQLDLMLSSWLSPLLAQSKEDSHSQLTQKVLPLLDTTAISALGGKLGCSQRTLERSFNKVTGLTLKQCQSMNKLEAMLEYLHQRNADEIDWVGVAYQFGFSDQPHLIRTLKKQIGITPKAYSKEGGLTIDVYGGISSIVT